MKSRPKSLFITITILLLFGGGLWGCRKGQPSSSTESVQSEDGQATAGEEAKSEEVRTAQQEPEERIQIFRIVYGQSLFPENVIFRDGEAGSQQDFSWSFYLVEIHTEQDIERILIDAGFHNDYLKNHFSIDYRSPLDILKSHGIEPEDIDGLIITHGHFDHSGNIGEFPNAQVVMANDAVDAVLKAGIPSKVVRYINSERGSRIQNIVEDTLVFNRFRCILVNGHAPGSMVVELEVQGEAFLFTGDEIYVPENLMELRPSGEQFSLQNNTRFLSRYRNDVLNDKIQLLPCHDVFLDDAENSKIGIFPVF